MNTARRDDIDVGLHLLFGAIIVAVVLLTLGCHDGCETDETRCNGTRVEVCNTETDWELSADCADIEDFGLGLEWTCCIDPEDGMHACLPADECDGDFDAGDGGS